jgi:ATP-dependent exoDNAse (exonuclease V) alpha subunit
MTKRKIGEVLWLALECAKSDRQSLVDAYSGDTKEDAVKTAMSDIKAFESLQIRLFGKTKSKLQEMIDGMTPKSIFAMKSEDLEIREEP